MINRNNIYNIINFISILSSIYLLLGCSADPRIRSTAYYDRLTRSGLKVLDINSSIEGLLYIALEGANIVDLSDLHGLPIQGLDIKGSAVRDLSPLKGCPLTRLYLVRSKSQDVLVSDLSPLRGMKIEKLYIDGGTIHDLSPLGGMPLREVFIMDCKDVTNLWPIRNAPINVLCIDGTGVKDLSSLKDMPLKYLQITPSGITNGMGMLRKKKSLIKINGRTAAEFWTLYDDGAYDRPY